MAWKRLTQVFNEHYAGRPYTKLQSHYSMKLNKRDRSKDPPRLMLPARYAHEADIDWSVVHAANPGPAFAGIGREAASLRGENTNHKPDTDIAFQKPFEIQDPSGYSSTEPTTRHERPRRAVPKKDYTWPRNHLQLLSGEVEDEQLDTPDSAEMRMQVDSEEPPESLNPAPEVAIAVDNVPEPMEQHTQEDSLVALSLRRRSASNQKVPYLSILERSAVRDPPHDQEWDQPCSRDWQGSLIHVDFCAEEFDIVEKAVFKVLNMPRPRKSTGRRKRMQKLLGQLAEPKLVRLRHELRRYLPCRNGRSIEAFLQDALVGQVQVIHMSSGRQIDSLH